MLILRKYFKVKTVQLHMLVRRSRQTQAHPCLHPTENTRELVTDFLRKAKQLEYLISVLPSGATPASNERPQAGSGQSSHIEGTADTNGDADADEREFEELQKEMLEVNQEYLTAVEEAGQSCLA